MNKRYWLLAVLVFLLAYGVLFGQSTSNFITRYWGAESGFWSVVLGEREPSGSLGEQTVLMLGAQIGDTTPDSTPKNKHSLLTWEHLESSVSLDFPYEMEWVGRDAAARAIGQAEGQTPMVRVTGNWSSQCNGGANDGNACVDAEECPGGTCNSTSFRVPTTPGIRQRHIQLLEDTTVEKDFVVECDATATPGDCLIDMDQNTVADPDCAAGDWRMFAAVDGSLQACENGNPGPLVTRAGDNYGHMYTNSTITVTISASDTPTEVGDTFTAGELGGSVTFGSSHFLDVGAAGAGIYVISWSMSMSKPGGGTIQTEQGIMVDGVARSEGIAHRTLASSSDVGASSGAVILMLALDDEISLFVENETDTTNLDVEHANLAITLISTAP